MPADPATQTIRLRARSAGDSTRSRCTGLPSSQSTLHAPQMPPQHEAGMSMPRSRSAASIVCPGSTRVSICERANASVYGRALGSAGNACGTKRSTWTRSSGQSRETRSKSSIMPTGPQHPIAVLGAGRPISAARSGRPAVVVSCRITCPLCTNGATRRGNGGSPRANKCSAKSGRPVRSSNAAADKNGVMPMPPATKMKRRSPRPESNPPRGSETPIMSPTLT